MELKLDRITFSQDVMGGKRAYEIYASRYR